MSNYCSSDSLDTYSFHDCILKEISIRRGEVVLELSHIDVLKSNTMNDTGKPKMTSGAKVVFVNCRIKQIKLQHPSSNGASAEETLRIRNCQLEDRLKGGVIINCEPLSNNDVELAVLTNEFILVTMHYNEVCVNWNEFVGYSWFVGHK